MFIKEYLVHNYITFSNAQFGCRKLELWLVATALPHLAVEIDYVLD